MSIAKQPTELNGGRVKGVAYLNDPGHMSPSKSMSCIAANAVQSERAEDASFNRVPCPLCGVHLVPRMGRRGPIVPCRCKKWRAD